MDAGTWKGMPVAVKAIMFPATTVRSDIAKEMAVGTSLNHPNIVSIYTHVVKQLSVNNSGIGPQASCGTFDAQTNDVANLTPGASHASARPTALGQDENTNHKAETPDMGDNSSNGVVVVEGFMAPIVHDADDDRSNNDGGTNNFRNGVVSSEKISSVQGSMIPPSPPLTFTETTTSVGTDQHASAYMLLMIMVS